MNKLIDTVLVTLVVSVCFLNLVQVTEIKDLKGEIKHQQQQCQQEIQEQRTAHTKETEQLLKQLEDIKAENNSLATKNKELQAVVSDLEGVRSCLINSVGYVPSHKEIDLLERLVECEAGGESLEGKKAVANVVVNRVNSESFPSSISEVIHQTNQFQPVGTGIIYSKEPSAESKQAVKSIILGERVMPSDIVNFWAKWLNPSHEVWQHLTPEFSIGVHNFSRGWQ